MTIPVAAEGKALPRFRANAAAFAARLKRRRQPAPPWLLNRHVHMVGSGAAVAALFIVVAVLALDYASVGWARGLPAATREVFGGITRYGKSDWLLIPTGVFGLFLLFGAWRRVERRIAAAWTEIGALVFFFFVSVAGAGLTTDLVKFLVGRSRPWRFDTDGVLSFSPFAIGSAYYSFPSGHATTIAAAAMACILMMRRARWIAVLCVAGAGVVAVSRIPVGAHFPSDVVAGIFVGTVFTYLFALGLGRSGVAFERRADGSLVPKTVAIRSAFRRQPRIGALLTGLVTAYAPARPPPAPPPGQMPPPGPR